MSGISNTTLKTFIHPNKIANDLISPDPNSREKAIRYLFHVVTDRKNLLPIYCIPNTLKALTRQINEGTLYVSNYIPGFTFNILEGIIDQMMFENKKFNLDFSNTTQELLKIYDGNKLQPFSKSMIDSTLIKIFHLFPKEIIGNQGQLISLRAKGQIRDPLSSWLNENTQNFEPIAKRQDCNPVPKKRVISKRSGPPLMENPRKRSKIESQKVRKKEEEDNGQRPTLDTELLQDAKFFLDVMNRGYCNGEETEFNP